MNRYCLLDFDGVILRRHFIHDVVRYKCNMFVSRKMDIPLPVASKVNKDFYEYSGHTVLGLRKMGINCSVPEFNEYVYGDIDYSYLMNTYSTNNDLCLDHFRHFLEICYRKKYVPLVFSNAPDRFVTNILDIMSVNDPTIASYIYSLGSTRLFLNDDVLKPYDESYNIIECNLGSTNTEYLFIDDKLTNLMPVYDRKHWKKILLLENENDINPCNDTNIHIGDIFVCHNLTQASRAL